MLAGVFDQPLREAGGGGSPYHGGNVAEGGPCRGSVVGDSGQGAGEDQPVEEEGDGKEEEDCGRGRGWELRKVHFDLGLGSSAKLSSCPWSRDGDETMVLC